MNALVEQQQQHRRRNRIRFTQVSTTTTSSKHKGRNRRLRNCVIVVVGVEQMIGAANRSCCVDSVTTRHTQHWLASIRHVSLSSVRVGVLRNVVLRADGPTTMAMASLWRRSLSNVVIDTAVFAVAAQTSNTLTNINNVARRARANNIGGGGLHSIEVVFRHSLILLCGFIAGDLYVEYS